MTQFPAPSPLPPLNIPPSDAVVTVSIIDNTSYIKGIPTSFFFEPSIKGYDVLDCPAYNFLIEHDASGKKLLFDLGIAKDWRSGPPIIANLIIQNGWQLDAPKDVSDILTEHDVPLESISSIIWSHYHFDHTGDPSLFPPTTSLTVGPGFKKVLTPGYPTNPAAPILESAYKGRELVEISFDRSPELLLGRFRAFDYFGDGSFYLIDAPGHAVGHICGLARTTPDTFVFMGGDACHHVGELRPTQYLPLPEHITPNPFKQQSAPCPGSILLDVHHCHSATEPFYKIAEGIFHENSSEAQKSTRKLEEFDGHPNILTVIAHDETLLDILDFYPKHMNDWHSKGHKNRGMWEFVRDFKEEVKMD